MASAIVDLPSRMGWTTRDFCAGVPKWRSGGSAMEGPRVRAAPTPTEAIRASSSPMTIYTNKHIYIKWKSIDRKIEL